MNKLLLLIIPILFISLNLTAQSEVEVVKNTLRNQMTETFEKSNSYQEYKVIKKTELSRLQKNILDSLSLLENKIAEQSTIIGTHKETVDSLTTNLSSTKQNLSKSQEKEDGIEILGILTQKSTYNTFMWTIILILLAGGGYLFYRFLNSHKITNATELKMAEIEIELEDYRRNSLEREQKLRRKLQDELNKNRKS